MATATGGGAIGPVGAMAIWTVEIDAGTNVNGGLAGIDGAGGTVGICWNDGPPCNSSFLWSNVAIRDLITATLCRVSSGLPMRSL
jgi:hypothetical protein